MRCVWSAAAFAAVAMLPLRAMPQEAPAPSRAIAQTAPPVTIGDSLSPEGIAAVDGVNSFSIDLYKRALRPGQNLFLSPASVSTAMALAYRGAVGTTADQLRHTLHYNAAPDAYFKASAQVFATMNFSGESRELRTANAIWVQDGMPLNADYRSDVQTYMKSGLQQVDFKSDPERARSDINGWVATATHDRILELLQPGIVNGGTRAVLVNAIYWKGRWQSTFDAGETKTEPFTRLDGKKLPTPLMHQRSRFVVIQRGDVQAIALPYVGDEVSMVVFLPRSPKGLPKFEASLTDPELRRWFDALSDAQQKDTILTLPKMHLEWQKDLEDMLAEMGAPAAFGDRADFSGMVKFPYPGSGPFEIGLKIDGVIHKSWLDVDEEGAEAAAATAAVTDIVVDGLRVPLRPPPPPVIFRADRPFLFALRDGRTGLILFMGRYVGPPASSLACELEKSCPAQ